MNSQLAQKIALKPLLRFTFPTIIMMVVMSLYTIVDGAFVSRLIGTDALSAVNIVWPLISVVIAFGIMLGTGASAVIAKKLGEGREREACENFTFITAVSLGFGILLTVVCLVFANPMIRFLGANDAIFDFCREYIRPLALFVPMNLLQMQFQFLFVTAGHPKLGLALTVCGGLANIGLDYLFIAVFHWGIAGAAIATGIGYSIPAVYGLFFFSLRRDTRPRFVRPKADWRALLKSCTNGSSEMVSNASSAIIAYLFNILMMYYIGQDGVAAVTIVLYAEFLLVAVYLGYTSGMAPLVSYNYGAGNTDRLQKLHRLSLQLIGGSSVVVLAVSLLLAAPVVGLFTSPDSPVYPVAVRGFYLYAISYLFKGINIYASGLFTALSNGKVSAILSFLRGLVLIVASMALLVALLGVDGIWLAVPLAEALSLLVSLYYLRRMRPVYQYA